MFRPPKLGGGLPPVEVRERASKIYHAAKPRTRDLLQVYSTRDIRATVRMSDLITRRCDQTGRASDVIVIWPLFKRPSNGPFKTLDLPPGRGVSFRKDSVHKLLFVILNALE